MRKLPLITVITGIALQSGFAAAQVCYSAVTETTPDSRFVINEDGTVNILDIVILTTIILGE